MNIQQLNYILEIEKHGSISKAASFLFISQPSLSNSIKELEKELGVNIFLRNNNGIKLTPKGQEICRYAKNILSELENITNIKESKAPATFRLVSENYSFVMETFVKMCVKYDEHDNKNQVNFTLSNADMMGVIRSISRLNSDLGILLINNSSVDACNTILSAENAEFIKICTFPININLSKTHPLLARKTFPMNELSSFMFVKYASEKDTALTYMPEIRTLGIINPDKIISVTDRELKCNIVASTSAFSIGCTMHPHFMNKFNITSVPIPGIFANLGYIKMRNSHLSDEALTFINMLREEVKLVSELTTEKE